MQVPQAPKKGGSERAAYLGGRRGLDQPRERGAGNRSHAKLAEAGLVALQGAVGTFFVLANGTVVWHLFLFRARVVAPRVMVIVDYGIILRRRSASSSEGLESPKCDLG